ncbi:ABC transporter permease [Haematospirillum sp. H1815]|uniref:ABC transporter permease n=1 Tax=Haematospirillum sp. H1815 TaxID=2723108 RepID=UPI001438D3E2|nr:ABC transporter permease [Haematospirillum sp. H1815]NKD76971.1 ABC transporter permease [Haematospirillum sp. H1815]
MMRLRASAARVGAVCLRHLYVMRSSPVRVLEMIYWPTMQMVLWGFFSNFFRTQSSLLAQAASIFIGAMLLWDSLFRSNLGVSVSFLEEMWSRNLGHLFVSPLRPAEYLMALVLMSLLRTLTGILPACLLAIPFYEYNIFQMGFPLIAFFVNVLVTGWALGFVISALILRFGMGAESLAWVVVFAFAPFSAIYYPVSSLPGWLQAFALCLPQTHVFEGMRSVLFEGVFDYGHFQAACALNLVFLLVAGAGFLYSFRLARQKGLLLGTGE